MSIQQQVQAVRARMAAAAESSGRRPEDIALCAATKVQSDDTIRAAIAAGITLCGENRTNKVKQVVGRVDLIQSVGSEHLLQAVEAQADKLGLVQDILLEVNIGMEESKGGVDPVQLRPLAELAQSLPHVRLRGLMAIPPISPLPGANRPFFAKMYQLFVDIRREMSDNQCDIDCLSMGMSGDFEDAIAEGATLVRVGTALFGPRPPMHTAR